MFLYYIKDDAMICDFQMIYDTDNKLHFDFYAYGLMKEPEILGIDVCYDLLSYGMVKIAKNDLEKLDMKIEEIVHNDAHLYRKILEMKATLVQLTEANQIIETSMEHERYCHNECQHVLDAVIKVMAYRRLAEKAEEYLFEDIDLVRFSELKTPSYLSMLKANRENIESLDDVHLFIKEYAYLNSFLIRDDRCDESSSYAVIRENGINIKPVYVPYDDSLCENLYEKSVYGLTYYGEVRHIYQLRTLRNVKSYMKKLNLDIFETDMKELMAYV